MKNSWVLLTGEFIRPQLLFHFENGIVVEFVRHSENKWSFYKGPFKILTTTSEHCSVEFRDWSDVKKLPEDLRQADCYWENKKRNEGKLYKPSFVKPYGVRDYKAEDRQQKGGPANASPPWRDSNGDLLNRT